MCVCVCEREREREREREFKGFFVGKKVQHNSTLSRTSDGDSGLRTAGGFQVGISGLPSNPPPPPHPSWVGGGKKVREKRRFVREEIPLSRSLVAASFTCNHTRGEIPPESISVKHAS